MIFPDFIIEFIKDYIYNYGNDILKINVDYNKYMWTGLKMQMIHIFIKTIIDNTIQNICEEELKKRRYKGVDLTKPIHIDTRFSVSCDICADLTDHSWKQAFEVLKIWYPSYQLFFSETAELNDYSSIPCFWGRIKSIDPNQFLIEINTARKLVNKDRITGTLIGQAVGDAIGVRYRACTSHQVRILLEKDMVNKHLAILGGGPSCAIPGQFSVNTKLALIISQCMLVTGTAPVTKFYIAKGFIDLYQSTLSTDKIVNRAFGGINPLFPPDQIYTLIIDKVSQLNVDSSCITCLMSSGVLAIGNNDSEFIIGICDLISSNYIIRHALLTFVNAIHYAIMGLSREEICTKAMCHLRVREINEIFEAVQKRIIKPTTLGIALQLAYSELLYGNSFEESMLRVVKYGGDTDNNLSIVGMLLGAYYGYSQIPKDWTVAVETFCNVSSVAEKLGYLKMI